MALRGGRPARFIPKGLSDTLDGSNSSLGGDGAWLVPCSSLINLIRDPGTPGLFVCRPAAVTLTSFPGFNTPGVVSVAHVIGTRVYGLVATARNAGKDEPFCYDTSTGLFVVVGNVLAGNTPASPPTSGAWNPPTMALVGVKLMVTHPNAPATTVYWFDLTNPAAPTWNSGNTTTTGLPSSPTVVAQFANRAWYVCGNLLYYSDVLNANTITNATQFLTIGSTTSIVAMQSFPLNTTSTGVLQALIVFKESSVWQVTGDAASSNLALNLMSATVGCLAQRSVSMGPISVFFAAHDGVRMVMADGSIAPPLPNVVLPFEAATVPSRIAACYNNSIYRTCFETQFLLPAKTVDYWFDVNAQDWTGPHTIVYDFAVALSGTFVIASSTYPGKLLTSDPVQSLTSTFTENGAAMVYTYQTSILPSQVSPVSATYVAESTLDIAFSGSVGNVTVSVVDASLGVLNTVIISPPAGGPLWGTAVWGAFTWGGTQWGVAPYTLPWSSVVVFKKAALRISGSSAVGVKFGAFDLRLKSLGYMNRLG